MRKRAGERVRVRHEKERWGEFTIRKSDGMRVPQKKERSGNSLQKEIAMGWEFTMRKRAMR